MQQSKQKTLVLGALLALGITSTVQAALIDRGSGLIYDDVLDVTWLQDANYAFTSGYAAANEVDNGSGAYDNILANGRMGWDAANTWAANLSVGGYDDWRLPTLSPVNDSAFDYNFTYDGSTDRGYNITSANSEMAYMFYENLGNTGYYDTLGVTTGCTGADLCLTNRGVFNNLESSVYWSGVEYAPNPSVAWAFNTISGYQAGNVKTIEFYAWAVRSGDVTASVPTPVPFWLIGSGLIGLMGWKRKR